MTIRVTNLPAQVAEGDLRKLFSSFGVIQKIDIKLERDDNTAYVQLEDGSSEARARNDLNGTEWFGQIIRLEIIREGSREGGQPKSNPIIPPEIIQEGSREDEQSESNPE
ncbi:RNA-binding protein [Geitlerinema sp. PCC 7407]|uniref:RNA recognition motif domain-containing protein n=1 Tax=Geitlerinema sp. PCC 7407 TaxID=1173025 RepID=UPI00029FD758|nr:RNA-binding protein [Geitlerinema sp. PCC 7407]AFY66269.1 RNP-1 like RNA-binding protein [Geitlerinema sp. PCC 7407]